MTDAGGRAVCGSSLAGIAGSNPAEAWIIVSCKWRVLYR